MAFPFNSEVAGEFFESARQKSVSGQTLAQGGSIERAKMASNLMTTSAVTFVGAPLVSWLSGTVYVSSNAAAQTGFYATRAEAMLGPIVQGTMVTGVVAGPVLSHANMRLGLAQSKVLQSLTRRFLQTVGISFTAGAINQTLPNPVDTSGLSGTNFGAYEPLLTSFDLGGLATRGLRFGFGWLFPSTSDRFGASDETNLRTDPIVRKP